MMRLKLAVVVSLFFLITATSWAQPASMESAKALAQSLGQTPGFPPNLNLRFQVLAHQMKDLEKNDDRDDLLRFFTDTRVLFWNSPLSSNVETTMRQLEHQMVALAKAKGRELELPQVGYAPAPSHRLISPQKVSAEQLSTLTLHTEEVATDMLAASQSTLVELLILRDSLTRLRQDLADGKVAARTVRSVLDARARYLHATGGNYREPKLTAKMDVLAEALRGNFPPQRLRQGADQIFTL